MPVLKPKDLSLEETPEEKEQRREHNTTTALIAGMPNIPGITCLRAMSPLVMTALHRSSNPYVVGKRGFEKAGIYFNDDGNVKDFAAFGLAMMPKTAEVLLLWTCDREHLKLFAQFPNDLESAALDYMEEFPGGFAGLAEVTSHVAKAIGDVQLSKAVPSEDDTKPKATGLEGGQPGPKKPAHTGKPKS